MSDKKRKDFSCSLGEDVNSLILSNAGSRPVKSTSSSPQDSLSFIHIDLLHPFRCHPFKPVSGVDFERFCDSVRNVGITQPIIVRPHEEGGYEILSGHNRVNVAKEVGLVEVPAIVKDLSYAEAVIVVTDSNFNQRSLTEMASSELALALKMQRAALIDLKRAGSDSLADSDIYVSLSRSSKLSPSNIKIYLRLNYLIPELLELVDSKVFGVLSGCHLSFLTEDQQHLLSDYLKMSRVKVNDNTAKTIKNLAAHDNFSIEMLKDLLGDKSIAGTSFRIGKKLYCEFFTPDQDKKEVERILRAALTEYRLKKTTTAS